VRPSDWSPLGLAGDPTPGDPVVVRDGGRRYTQVAEAIARAAAALRSLEAGVSNVDSVKALLETRDTIVDGVGKAEGRYRAAGSALGTYATVLDRVQSETASALAAARSAAGAGAEAGSQQARFHRLAEEAEAAGDAEQQERYEKQERAAKADADQAAGAVGAQRSAVTDAVSDRNQAAQTAIDSIKEITANDGLNDSWWDDWGANLTEWVAKIAEAVAAIAGILALLVCWIPVVGQALAAVLLVVAAIAGIVAALANILLAAKGEKSWGEAALSVVFAALGCVGLGGLRGVLGGLKGAFGAWKAAGGLAGLGGLKALGMASLNNFALSMKNLAKFASLKMQPSATAIIGERKVSQEVYDALRAGTPSQAIRDLVNLGHNATVAIPDFALPGKTILGRLQADHIVSMDTIVRMEGFDALTKTQQLQVLNFPENFIGLSASANASKGALSYAEWSMHISSGLSVNPLFQTQMTHLGGALEGRLQALINSLL